MITHNMAVIVPTDGAPANKEEARQEIWGTVSHLLLPALGKLYGRFYPGQSAWGQKIPEPFGVILGRDAPERFLAFYLAGRQAQSGALEYHLSGLLKTIDPEAITTVEGSLVCPVVVDGSDREQTFHAVWHISLHKGAPLPDCGVYYAGLGRALASQEEERAILGNPAGYALCVVRLEQAEAQNG